MPVRFLANEVTNPRINRIATCNDRISIGPGKLLDQGILAGRSVGLEGKRVDNLILGVEYREVTPLDKEQDPGVGLADVWSEKQGQVSEQGCSSLGNSLHIILPRNSRL